MSDQSWKRLIIGAWLVVAALAVSTVARAIL